MNERDVLEAKRALIYAFQGLEGFEGCGIGAEGLCVLVKDEETRRRMPITVNLVPVEVIVTGGLRFLSINQPISEGEG